MFLSKFAIKVRIKRHSHFGICLLSRKPSNVVDKPRSMILSGRVGSEWCGRNRWHYSVGVTGNRNALGCFSYVIMCTVQNRQTTQHKETIKPLRAQTVRRHSKTPDPVSAQVTTCCFQLGYMFRHSQVNQTTKIQQKCKGESALANKHDSLIKPRLANINQQECHIIR